MKKIYMAPHPAFIGTLLFLIYSCITNAQINGAYLDTNNVKARINSTGDLFWDFSNSKYEVPKGSGRTTIFAGHLWMGGFDQNGQLHTATQTYGQGGNDFIYGPMPASSQTPQWNNVWKVNKSTIDSFLLGYYPSPPPSILNWPGNGNIATGQAQNLAPYKDFNNNSIYEPQNGEVPCIRGDQTLYFIFNDDSTHNSSGGQKLGVEVHGMAYAFDNLSLDSSIENTVFINYRIINRTSNQYDSVYTGLWTDIDLGNYADDYVGCDVERSSYYGYNGDNDDDVSNGGYGKYPPAQSVTFISAGPPADMNDGLDNDHDCQVDEPGERWSMSHFMYYENVNGQPYGNPSDSLHYYNYLRGKWRNDSSATYGGDGHTALSPTCAYMFPGLSDQTYGWGTGGNCITPSIQPAWDEIIAGNTPSDRRAIGSFGPFTLMPSAELCLNFAFVWAKTKDTANDPLSISALQNAIDTVRQFSVANNLTGCDCIMTLGISESELSNSIRVYPNPSNGNFTIESEELKIKNIEVLNILGEVIINSNSPVIDLSSRADGIYFVRAHTERGIISKKVIVMK